MTVLPPALTVNWSARSSIVERAGADDDGLPICAADDGGVRSCRRSRSGCPGRRTCRGCRRAPSPCGPGSPAALAGPFHRVVGVKTAGPRPRPATPAMPVASLVSVFSEACVEHRVQQLVERFGVDPQDRLFPRRSAFLRPCRPRCDRRRAGALAVAGLQHEQLARPGW